LKEVKNCILFSTADWDAPYWTNKQHTTKHLAERCIRVLYVESVGLRAPKFASGIDLARIWRRLFRGLRGVHQVEQNIWVISPLVIPFKHQWRIVRSINRWILNRTIIRFCKRQGFENKDTVIWTYHPYVLDYLNCIQYGSLVYHCVDDLSAIPGIDAEAFIAKEQDLLKGANVVFTTSKKLYEKCGAINKNTHDFPNVVDWEHFSQAFNPGPDPEDLKEIPHPRLGYVGVLSDYKVDFELLQNVAAERPDWHIVLIGEEREGQCNPTVQTLKDMENVHFLGYKKYEELPKYLRGLDVGLLPTLINQYTDSMFPMKYFEYLSSGLPVVSTDLRAIKDHKFKILNSENSFSFMSAIHVEIQCGKYSQDTAKALVEGNTWPLRLDKMVDIIKIH
jgi:glycosyltransferase involved in cell wall biosynthesis